jgi:hypothetical protein
MKLSWQSTRIWLKRPLDPSVPVVVKRFGVRLLILSVFAVLPLSRNWNVPTMFVALTGFNAVACFFTAMILREKPNARALNHFDEALGMAAFCLIARLFV